MPDWYKNTLLKGAKCHIAPFCLEFCARLLKNTLLKGAIFYFAFM